MTRASRPSGSSVRSGAASAGRGWTRPSARPGPRSGSFRMTPTPWSNSSRLGSGCSPDEVTARLEVGEDAVRVHGAVVRVVVEGRPVCVRQDGSLRLGRGGRLDEREVEQTAARPGQLLSEARWPHGAAAPARARIRPEALEPRLQLAGRRTPGGRRTLLPGAWVVGITTPCSRRSSRLLPTIPLDHSEVKEAPARRPTCAGAAHSGIRRPDDPTEVAMPAKRRTSLGKRDGTQPATSAWKADALPTELHPRSAGIVALRRWSRRPGAGTSRPGWSRRSSSWAPPTRWPCVGTRPAGADRLVRGRAPPRRGRARHTRLDDLAPLPPLGAPPSERRARGMGARAPRARHQPVPRRSVRSQRRLPGADAPARCASGLARQLRRLARAGRLRRSLRNHALLQLEHVAYVLTGVLLWWPALQDAPHDLPRPAGPSTCSRRSSSPARCRSSSPSSPSRSTSSTRRRRASGRLCSRTSRSRACSCRRPRRWSSPPSRSSSPASSRRR